MRRTKLKKFITSSALLLCLHHAAAMLHAQGAYKIDEVKNPRCDLSEVPQITDPPMPLFKALDENKEARAAIIVYGLPGEARRYAERVKQWLINSRGIESKRLAAAYGGSSDVLRLELWIVPRGASLPLLYKDEDNTKATRFDSYSYSDGETCEGGRLPALAEFAAALKQHPNWQGHIVVRPHRNKRGVSFGDEGWDSDGNVSRQQALRRAARDKRYLVREFGISPARIKAIAGNNDDWTHAELWLVPAGAESPEAKSLIR